MWHKVAVIDNFKTFFGIYNWFEIFYNIIRMRTFWIWNPISCITYRLGVLIFMNKPILVLNELMECTNNFCPGSV